MGRAQGQRQATSSTASFSVFGSRRGSDAERRDSETRNLLLDELQNHGEVTVGYLERLRAAGLTPLVGQYELLVRCIFSTLYDSESAVADATATLSDLAEQGQQLALGAPLIDGLSEHVRQAPLSDAAADSLLSLLTTEASNIPDSERLTLLARTYAERLKPDYDDCLKQLADAGDDDAVVAMAQIGRFDAAIQVLFFTAERAGERALEQLAPLLIGAGELLRASLLPDALFAEASRLITEHNTRLLKAAPEFITSYYAGVGHMPRASTEALYRMFRENRAGTPSAAL